MKLLCDSLHKLGKQIRISTFQSDRWRSTSLRFLFLRGLRIPAEGGDGSALSWEPVVEAIVVRYKPIESGLWIDGAGVSTFRLSRQVVFGKESVFWFEGAQHHDHPVQVDGREGLDAQLLTQGLQDVDDLLENDLF